MWVGFDQIIDMPKIKIKKEFKETYSQKHQVTKVIIFVWNKIFQKSCSLHL